MVFLKRSDSVAVNPLSPTSNVSIEIERLILYLHTPRTPLRCIILLLFNYIERFIRYAHVRIYIFIHNAPYNMQYALILMFNTYLYYNL